MRPIGPSFEIGLDALYFYRPSRYSTDMAECTLRLSFRGAQIANDACDWKVVEPTEERRVEVGETENERTREYTRERERRAATLEPYGNRSDHRCALLVQSRCNDGKMTMGETRANAQEVQ